MSALFNKYKQSMLSLSPSVDLDTDTIRVSIGRTTGTGSPYTFSAAHDFKDDVSTVQNADAALSSISVTDGVFDAGDAVFTAVAAQPGNAPLDFLVIWKDTGVASTSPVIAYIDGFSIIANGGNITVVWDNGTNRIFKL